MAYVASCSVSRKQKKSVRTLTAGLSDGTEAKTNKTKKCSWTNYGTHFERRPTKVRTAELSRRDSLCIEAARYEVWMISSVLIE